MLDDHAVSLHDSSYQSIATRPRRRRKANQNLFTILILIVGWWLQPSLQAQQELKAQPEGTYAACDLTLNQERIAAYQKHDLWDIVQSRCQPRDPDCLSDSRVISDNEHSKKPEAYLLIPLPRHIEGNESPQRVTGVECTKLVTEKPVSEMWDEAWTWAISQKLILPRDKPPSSSNATRANSRIGLAVNSLYRRSEGQLHIHISCVNSEVAAALSDEGPKHKPGVPFFVERLKQPSLTTDRKPHDEAKAGQLELTNSKAYQAVKVDTLTGTNSPFIVAANIFKHKDDMASQGIAVIPIGDPGEGFYILDTTYIGPKDATCRGPKDGGQAEDLLDQSCSKPTK